MRVIPINKKITMTQIYDKTFIIDFNERESGINAVWIPPGYRLIQVYYGGCDTYAVDHDDKEIQDEDYCGAAIDLAEHMNLSAWKENYPDVTINPETDIVLACNTNWDRRSEVLYLPPGIKAIWTSKALKKQGKEKIAAAKFLYSSITTG